MAIHPGVPCCYFYKSALDAHLGMNKYTGSRMSSKNTSRKSGTCTRECRGHKPRGQENTRQEIPCSPPHMLIMLQFPYLQESLCSKYHCRTMRTLLPDFSISEPGPFSRRRLLFSRTTRHSHDAWTSTRDMSDHQRSVCIL